MILAESDFLSDIEVLAHALNQLELTSRYRYLSHKNKILFFLCRGAYNPVRVVNGRHAPLRWLWLW
jgi:hypothetical protein